MRQAILAVLLTLFVTNANAQSVTTLQLVDEWVGGAVTATTTFSDNVALQFGTGGGTTRPSVVFSTAQAPDTGMLLTGSVSNHWVIAESADSGFDFAHAASAEPRIFLHGPAQNTATYLTAYHDGTTAYLETGTGELGIKIAGSTRAVFSTAAEIGVNVNTTAVGWGTGGGMDVSIVRNAAGVLRIGDGTTPAKVRGFLGGGTAVASATALPVPTGRIFHVTGTTVITSITSTNFQAGAIVSLIFDGITTFTDGSNLVLAGSFVTTADDTITLGFDGTNWYELSRSVN